MKNVIYVQNFEIENFKIDLFRQTLKHLHAGIEPASYRLAVDAF